MKKFFAIVAASVLSCGSLLASGSDVLITADEAMKLYGKPGVVFASGDNPDSFGLGHIPGSVVLEAHHLHHSDITGHMHCSPLYMCPDEAAEFLGSKGIDNDSTVICYDDFRGPNASGCYHFMKMYGHEKVKMLNGGMAQWKAVGGEVEKGKEQPREHKKYVITEDKIDHHIFADKNEVLKASNMIMRAVENSGDKTKSGYAILDSRSMIEIIGENKLDHVARGGHVPGSSFMEWKQVTDFDNKLSYPTDLSKAQAKLDSIGLTKDKKIYTYCHVGAGRGSYFWALMQMLGYENVKVYTGSWDEWGNDMSLPIQK